MGLTDLHAGADDSKQGSREDGCEFRLLRKSAADAFVAIVVQMRISYSGLRVTGQTDRFHFKF